MKANFKMEKGMGKEQCIKKEFNILGSLKITSSMEKVNKLPINCQKRLSLVKDRKRKSRQVLRESSKKDTETVTVLNRQVMVFMKVNGWMI